MMISQVNLPKATCQVGELRNAHPTRLMSGRMPADTLFG